MRRHNTTERRRAWAAEQARSRAGAGTGLRSQGDFDSLLLYYLFTSTAGPDYGVEGNVSPPEGEVPQGFTPDFAGDSYATTQYDASAADTSDSSASDYASSDSGGDSGGGFDSSGGGDFGGGGGGFD